MGCCESQNQISDKTIEDKLNEVQTTQVELEKNAQTKLDKQILNSQQNTIQGNIINEQQNVKPLSKPYESNYSQDLNSIAKNAQSILDQYQIEKPIGESIFGTSCLVTHKPSGQSRVMKIIPLKKISEQEKQLITKELNLLKQVDHPYIVKIFEYFQDEQNRYIISEYCSGQELLEFIKETNPFNEKIASKYIKQILSAIVYCHIFNIVHKHMKPENILFFTKQHNSSIKLIDFSNQIESKKQILLPPYYIPPETITDNKYDEKSDLWSVGIIMYILLNGSPPFVGNTDQKIYEKIKSGKYEIQENISSEAKDLMSQMLQVDPNKRISASEACAHPWIINNFIVEPFEPKLKEKINFFIQKCRIRSNIAYLLNNQQIFFGDNEKLKAYFDKDNSKEDLIKGYAQICGDEIKSKLIIEEIYKQENIPESNKYDINSYLLFYIFLILIFVLIFLLFFSAKKKKIFYKMRINTKRTK